VEHIQESRIKVINMEMDLILQTGDLQEERKGMGQVVIILLARIMVQVGKVMEDPNMDHMVQVQT